MQVFDLLKLLTIPGVGPQRARLLLAKFKTIANIFQADYPALCSVESIDNKLAQVILSHDEQLAEKQLEQLQKKNIKIFNFWDDCYPELLKSIFDPPLLLFYRGDLSVLKKSSVAIVGTRRCSEYGRKMAYDLALSLSNHCITVTSGLARGIDTYAHQGALNGKAKTIAVLGAGIDVIYPPENQELANRIADSGLVISEYLMGSEPLPGNFPRRNRIISGLSLGTVVVEAGIKSGAMITANIALEQGREVLAVPGRANHYYSKGPHKLLRDGAVLVESVDDIYNAIPALNASLQNSKQGIQQILLDPIQEEIMSYVKDEPVHIDQLAENMMKSTSELLTLMLDLELNNQVKQLSGMRFIRQ